MEDAVEVQFQEVGDNEDHNAPICVCTIMLVQLYTQSGDRQMFFNT